MRKLLTFIAGTLITGSLIAGGLVTNNNQSAMFTRLQNRNASTTPDAVFFNPAGLTKLGDGLFASVNNQTIFQTKTVTNDYAFLSGTKPREFVGNVKAPIYPGVYVAYNVGKLSFSAGFNPIGGGGGATYSTGLPSFEAQAAELVPLLNANIPPMPTTLYSADIFFEGSSVYFGIQGNVGYKINDMISVAAGLRVVSANNAYKGYMRGISVNPNYPAFGATYNGNNMVLAKTFFNSGATTLNGLATGATAYSGVLTGIIGGGVVPGTTPLTDGATNGLSPTQIGTIQAIITAAGLSPAGIDISTAQLYLAGAAPGFTAGATKLSGYAAKTSDVVVDAEQSGLGFTPILSVNFSPMENLNIAVKYEFQTKLDLTTSVIDGKNGAGIYIQDSVSIADLPASIMAGVEYRPFEKLMLAGSFNYYFDKNVDYDGQADVVLNKIDKNFLEYGLGAEYGVTEKLRLSAGWSGTTTGVNDNYQSDLTYSTNTNTLGGGLGYRINDMFDLNIGGQYTFYQEGTKSFTRLAPITETYNKVTWLLAIGLDIYFGK
jgi:long-chain fatty acid transport protein